MCWYRWKELIMVEGEMVVRNEVDGKSGDGE